MYSYAFRKRMQSRRPKALPYRVREVERVVQRQFPTLQIWMNPQEGCWILTDFHFHPNGAVNWHEVHPTMQSNRGALGGHLTDKATVAQFLLRNFNLDGETAADVRAYEPARIRLMAMLSVAFHGNSQAVIDALEDERRKKEEAEEARSGEAMREAGRESAAVAWDRYKGKAYSSAAGVTDQRGVSRSIDRKIREDQEEQDRERVAAAAAAIRRGHATGLG